MKKKVVAMFLAAVMALSLVACGSKSDNGGSGNASGTETIKLGGVGPLTGGYANYGLSVQHGAELAVKEINAAGGVNGKQLELSFQDSQGDPESAVAAYGKLMDWGMNVSLGAVLSGETASVVAAAKADDVLVMETTGSADKCIDGNDKAFRICFYDSYQGTAAADYLTDNALATEVGVFYQSDNDYSVGLYNAFVAECQNNGVTIKETQTFTTATSTDFSTQVNALASSGVKVVFIPIYAEEASTFLTQAKGKFADDVYFFGADGLDGILGKVSQDVTIADNVLMMTPFAADSADPKVQAFVKAYQDAYNATPDQFAADAYDAVYAVKAAVEAANGSTDSSAANSGNPAGAQPAAASAAAQQSQQMASQNTAQMGQPMGQPMGQTMMGNTMMNQNMGQPVNVQPAQFSAFAGGNLGNYQPENIDLIMDVPLQVTVELGRTTKSISDILDLGPGKIIELNKEKCINLVEKFPQATVIHGDGTDHELLLSESLEEMDAFIALTDNDEENVIISMFAQSHGVTHVLPKVNRVSLGFLLEKLGLENSITPKFITANQIVQYVRAMQNTVGSNVESLIKLVDDKVEALEFRVRDNCRFIDVPIKDLNIRKGIIIAYVTHKGVSKVATGDMRIQLSDTVIIISRVAGLRDINDLLS